MASIDRHVTRDVMPRLTALGQRGTIFTAHHSVFPTVTRVNAASFVTGAYPEAHGIMGNTIYIPSATLHLNGNPATIDGGQLIANKLDIQNGNLNINYVAGNSAQL